MRFIKFIFKTIFAIGCLCLIAGVSTAIYIYLTYSKGLPTIDKLADYRPKAVSTIYARDGSLLSELFNEKRYPAKLNEIPTHVRNAFVAAEDANFYNHPGIDFISIIRAAWINLQHKSTKQGASTITQQLVKSLLLTREKTYERKIKEAILSYRIENRLSKNEILEIYLNEIYLGSGSFGIKAAAKAHFKKEVEDLTIAEAAYLGGLPQKPGRLSLVKYRDEAFARQRYVLRQMYENNFINKADYEKAAGEKIKVYEQDTQTIFAAPYFTTHVIRTLGELAKTNPQIEGLTDPGGYKIYTTADRKLNDFATLELQKNLRTVDKRRGFRGASKNIAEDEKGAFYEKSEIYSLNDLKPDKIYQARIESIKNKIVGLRLGAIEGVIDFQNERWAYRKPNAIFDERGVWTGDTYFPYNDPLKELKIGDILEISYEKPEKEEAVTKFRLEQTPELQSAFVLEHIPTGEVRAIVGGYDFSKSKFNRATQGKLQPGSSFKPFIYLAALEKLGLTPASIVPDSPITLLAGDGRYWSPQNYDEKFLGPITLRTALQRSRNVISVYLLNLMGPKTAIDYAKKFGLTTSFQRNLSLALGTSEVHPIEMVHAYSAFANSGWLRDQTIIKKIEDRNGNVIYESKPTAKKIIDDDHAFIMANMMKGVVERGTAQLVKQLEKPAAGKTGTTNEMMDAWFIGYTPEWVAGVWTGFDKKQTIGPKETGGRVSAPVFLNVMKEVLKDSEPLDFEISENVVPVRINPETGSLSSSGGFLEYFILGTEPKRGSGARAVQNEYLSGTEF